MEGDRGKADAREIQRMQEGDGRKARKWGCEGGSDVCVCVCAYAREQMEGEGETLDAREAAFCMCAGAME